MKFTLAWLKDHLETTAPLDEILEALTDLGLEVEEVSNPLDRLGDFTVGLIPMSEIAFSRGRKTAIVTSSC